MRKDWILSDEEKVIKREKVERNRLLKQQAHIASQQITTADEMTKNSRALIVSSDFSHSPYMQIRIFLHRTPRL